MRIIIIGTVIAGCLAVGLVQWGLAQLRPAWPGAVLPVVWLAIASWWTASGRVELITGILGAIGGVVILWRGWSLGRARRRAARPSSPVAG